MFDYPEEGKLWDEWYSQVNVDVYTASVQVKERIWFFALSVMNKILKFGLVWIEYKIRLSINEAAKIYWDMSWLILMIPKIYHCSTSMFGWQKCWVKILGMDV